MCNAAFLWGRGKQSDSYWQACLLFSAECFSMYSKGPAHINMVYLPNISQGFMIISWFKMCCNTLKNFLKILKASCGVNVYKTYATHF